MLEDDNFILGQALFLAAADNCISDIQGLLETNPSADVVNWRDNAGKSTPLHSAAEKGHQHVVRALLSHPDIDANPQDLHGQTPLLLACSFGRVEVVRLLLENKANVNHGDEDGRTPLLMACFWGEVEIIKWMFALRGRELDLGRKVYGMTTPLEVARDRGELKTVELLKRFAKDRIQTSLEAQVELGLSDLLAGQLFALVVFLCDGIVDMAEAGENPEWRRFFRISGRLPLELQMVLCRRAFSSMKNSIASKWTEPGFRLMAQVL